VALLVIYSRPRSCAGLDEPLAELRGTGAYYDQDGLGSVTADTVSHFGQVELGRPFP